MVKEKNALEKARSLLKKAEHAHTPSSIKKRLKKARAPKAKPRKQKGE
jgi:hypothetical protein